MKVLKLRWTELGDAAEAIMATYPEVKKEWLAYVCSTNAADLLVTDHDWPLAFFVWYHGRRVHV